MCPVNNDSPSSHISITPQMIIAAVKRLSLHKAYVPSGLISNYLRYTYPVRSNLKLFAEELAKKLACAVHVGLLRKHGEDAYYLPTLRQSANDFKSAYTEFWEIYHKYTKSACTSKSQKRNEKVSMLKKKPKKM